MKVEEIVRNLKDKDPKVREGAAAALHELASKRPDDVARYAGELADALKDESSGVRLRAAKALAELAVLRGSYDLRKLLKHRDPEVRWGAAAALAELASKRPESLIPHMEEIIKASEDFVAKALDNLESPEAALEHLEALKGHPKLLNKVLSRVDLKERPDLVRYLKGIELPERLERQVLELAARGDEEALKFVVEAPELAAKLPSRLIEKLPNRLEVLASVRDERLLDFLDDIASGLAEGDGHAAKAFLNLSLISPEAAYRMLPVLRYVELNDDLRKALVNLAKAGYDVKDLAFKDEVLLREVAPYLDAKALVEAARRFDITEALLRAAEERPEELAPYLEELESMGLRKVVAKVVAKLSVRGDLQALAPRGSTRPANVPELHEASGSPSPRSLEGLALKLPPLNLRGAEGSYGNYLILGLIGEGGYARVYLARHRYLGSKVL